MKRLGVSRSTLSTMTICFPLSAALSVLVLELRRSNLIPTSRRQHCISLTIRVEIIDYLPYRTLGKQTKRVNPNLK